MYKCEEEIRNKIEEFKMKLNGTKYTGTIGMIRDYSIKLEMCKENNYIGILHIFYSPKKKRYTLKNEKLSEEVFKELEEIFQSSLLKKCDNEEEKKEIKNRNEINRLKRIYEILKEYKDIDIDFNPLYVILEKICDEEDKKKIKENPNDFYALEKVTLKLLEGIE